LLPPDTRLSDGSQLIAGEWITGLLGRLNLRRRRQQQAYSVEAEIKRRDTRY
jgi:hypothetical protein